MLPLTPSLELGNMFFSHYCWWCWGELLTNGVRRIDPSWQLSLHSVSCSPPPPVGWGRESDGWKWEEKPVDQDQDSLINERKKNKWCRSNHSPPASPQATAALEKLPPVLLLWMILYSRSVHVSCPRCILHQPSCPPSASLLWGVVWQTERSWCCASTVQQELKQCFGHKPKT